MLVKAFVIGILVGVALAVPLVTTDPSLVYETILDCNNPNVYDAPEGVITYEVKNNFGVVKTGDIETEIVLLPDKSKTTDKLETKWDSIKSHVDNIYENLKKKYYKSTLSGQNYSSDKNKTMHLLNETQKVYQDIVVGGKNNFTAFEAYRAQLINDVKAGVENKSDIALTKFEELLKGLKDEIHKAKIAQLSKAIPVVGEVSGQKTNWDHVISNWQNIHKELTDVWSSIIDSFKNVGKETKISYRNVKKDLSEIKSNIIGLAQKAEKEFTEIVKGKQDITEFKSLYSEILTMFTDLTPMVGEVFEEVELQLIHVNKKLDDIMNLRSKDENEV